MERKWSVHTVLLGLVFGILIIYGGIKLDIHPFQAVEGEVAEELLEQSKVMYLTGFSYLEGDKSHSMGEWLLSKANELIPLGGYVEGKSASETDTSDADTYAMILAAQANDENEVGADGQLVNGEDDSAQTLHTTGVPLDTSIEKMSDFNYLISNFYAVDSSTMIRPDELKGEELLSKNMKINQETDGPKILVYHTHSQEMFADSVEGDPSTSIVGVGDYLTELLNHTYQIQTLHHTGVYDLINGELDRSKAYDMAKPDIQKILEENPTIEVVIDLHRDGVNEGTHLVTEVNGKQTAQIMFFNGLSKTRANGEIDYLANPYIQDNLAFSLQMQVAANNKYPGFARRIYLRGYRYNMHFMPKSLLIEAGAQTNTVEEMKNAMEVLADLLHTVLIE
ncbi:MAG: stage II sporulation protein P [Dorea sp.]